MNQEHEASPTPLRRILVLDDEPELGRLLIKLFTRFHYDVTAVEEGSEAIRVFEQAAEGDTPFDLAILDLTIPKGLGGKEVVIALNRIQPGIKSIAASGISEGMEQSFAEHGFSAFIGKPFNILELKELAENLLKSSA